jgi:hypothetical protein
MTSRTRNDLIVEVLDQLGATAMGQNPNPEDVQKIDTRLDNMLDEISALGIYTVVDAGEVGPSGGDFDAAALRSLAAFIANMCAGNFGLGADPSLFVLATRAEKTLRTIDRPAKARVFLKTDAALRGHRLWPGRGNYSSGT